MDLTFPHHENEIAQSCGAHKKIDNPRYFAKYWFHNGFVIVDSKKMSKSIGNIKLVHNLINNYHGEVLRLTLLSAHYRQPLNWTVNSINQNNAMLERLYRGVKELNKIEAGSEEYGVPDNIMEALCDDLNTPKALAELNLLSNSISTVSADEKKKIKGKILATGKLIGILQEDPDKWLGYGYSESLDNKTIENLIKKRNEARRNKNFALADTIRDELKNKKIEIEDTKDGTIWRSIE